ncbi:putative TIM-barrel fold metal-dependent hydrolase [Natronospira proteinivora]|uniref:TIM-barrel fold metal-dependent hydrolase n=1 Tax=Natronospira proteinivora TaxID=1807133 RepID=A0ABT1G6X6_9GAMM|nr:amidohydrolase family protein [Natronospira proteinivora]MCP1727050.1 putative TIM-barrel fold metal-dependent hydrolase [Natronospira proteinivora]
MIPRASSWPTLLLTAITALGMIACASSPSLPPPAADHHLHIRSDTGGEALPRVQLARGKSRSELSPGRQDADDVLKEMDRHGIQQGVLLSLGYMYAIPEINFENEYRKVRQENDFVAEQAARYPDRLIAFCGISPIRDYSLKEIQRCAGMDVTGIKMHMANSGVDLDNPRHWASLEAAFREANARGLAIVIHYRPRNGGYGAAEAERFMTSLMPLASDVTVQLAHMGGGGIIDTATMSAIRRFAQDLDDYPNLYFDISAAWAREQDVPASVERIERHRNRRNVARAVEWLGTDRILFGSDWDSIEFQDTLQPLQRTQGLTAEIAKEILSNRAPYLPQVD